MTGESALSSINAVLLPCSDIKGRDLSHIENWRQLNCDRKSLTRVLSSKLGAAVGSLHSDS